MIDIILPFFKQKSEVPETDKNININRLRLKKAGSRANHLNLMDYL